MSFDPLDLTPEQQRKIDEERALLNQIIETIDHGKQIFAHSKSSRASMIRALRSSSMTIGMIVKNVLETSPDGFLDEEGFDLQYRVLRIKNSITIMRASLDWLEEATSHLEKQGPT